MTSQRKIFALPIAIGIIAISIVVFSSYLAFAATKMQPVKVVGMAKFVLKGTVISISADTITLRITNTSKNAKLFDNKDKTISVGSKTTVTKKGKNVSLKQIKSGDKVKVFGIFDKKTGSITLVRWIKVVSK